MSRYLESPSGGPVAPADLQVVGRIHYEQRFWGMVYSLVPLTGKRDMSAVINRQVRVAGGDGVTALTVESDGCGWNAVPVLALLPIWPGCVKVVVSGNVVKVQPVAARSDVPDSEEKERVPDVSSPTTTETDPGDPAPRDAVPVEDPAAAPSEGPERDPSADGSLNPPEPTRPESETPP